MTPQESKSLFLNLTISKRHTNLHVLDVSTQKKVSIRDAGLIPALQPLISYMKKHGENKESELSYFDSKRRRLRKWKVRSFSLFLSNVELLRLLPEKPVGKLKELRELSLIEKDEKTR
ncbi:MAG: hypothetical protein ACP5KW_09360 [Thermoproteota archaeon]